MKITPAIALVSPLMLALAACSTKQASHTADAPAALSVAFNGAFAGCHGDSGQGGFGPALAGSKLSLADFTATVRAGSGPMPAFGAADYTDAQLSTDYGFLTGK